MENVNRAPSWGYLSCEDEGCVGIDRGSEMKRFFCSLLIEFSQFSPLFVVFFEI